MNAIISETIGTMTIKFGDNMFYYWTQLKLASEFEHAPFRLRKSIKIQSQALIYSYYIHFGAYTVQMLSVNLVTIR